jgi:hypothetical protein
MMMMTGFSVLGRRRFWVVDGAGKALFVVCHTFSMRMRMMRMMMCAVAVDYRRRKREDAVR